MEHRRASVTMAVDERDVTALREWAQEKYGTIDRYAEIVRDAIVDALRRAGKLQRAVASDKQKVIWFAECPPIRAWHRARVDAMRKAGAL